MEAIHAGGVGVDCVDSERPSVSVVVPFRGDEDAGARLLTALSRLALRDGDEVIVADNTDRGVETLGAQGVTVVRAGRERSSYHARNAGARTARNGWLLFVDADCTPDPSLLEAYFAEPIDDACGAVAGAIEGDATQASLVPRYVRSRKFFSSSEGLLGPDAAPTGNLLVRRAAFASVGGFAEGIRSAGDVDMARRLQAAGWGIGHRPRAKVRHRHRESLTGLLAAFARYGAGARWLNQRYPGSAGSWPLLAGLRGAAADALRLAARGHLEEALFRGLDAAGLVAHRIGYAASNTAPRL